MTHSAEPIDVAQELQFTRELLRSLTLPRLPDFLPMLGNIWHTAAHPAVVRIAVASASQQKLLICEVGKQRSHSLKSVSLATDDIGDESTIANRLAEIPLSQKIDQSLQQRVIAAQCRDDIHVLYELTGATEVGDWRAVSEWSTDLIDRCLQEHPDGFEDEAVLSPDRDKLEALAEFAAGAGHEINNPLATITGRVQLLLRGEEDPDRRLALDTIGGQALRIRDMIGDTMLFGRPPKPTFESINLSAAVESVVDALSDQITTVGCRLSLELDEQLEIAADRVQLSVLISSLILNSLEAIDEGGLIQITTLQSSEFDRQFAELIVKDDGIGLDETDRQHLFDPFYSGRQAGRGLGFGLSKCWKIAEQHGARIAVISSKTVPFEISVVWPLANVSTTRVAESAE